MQEVKVVIFNAEPLYHSAALFHYSAADTHTCMWKRQNFVIKSRWILITDSVAVTEVCSKSYFGCSCEE